MKPIPIGAAAAARPSVKARLKSIDLNYGTPFWALTASQILSGFAHSFCFFASMWYMGLHKASKTELCLYLFPALVVSVYVSPFFGYAVDRYSRPLVLRVGIGLTVLAAALALLGIRCEQRSLWPLVSSNLFMTAGSAFVWSTSSALAQELVPEHQLRGAAPIGHIAAALPNLAGGFAVGMLAEAVETATAFWVALACALCALALSSAVERQREANGPEITVEATEPGHGFRIGRSFTLLSRTRLLLPMAAILFGINLMLTPLSVCLPLWVSTSHPDVPWLLGLLYSMHGLTDLLGASLGPLVGRSRRPDLVVTAGLSTVGFAFALAFSLHNVPVSLCLYAVAALCNTACLVHLRAQMMLGVPGPLFGRVDAAYHLLSQAGMPAGIVLLGLMPPSWPPSAVLVFGCAAAGGLGLLFPMVRNFGGFATITDPARLKDHMRLSICAATLPLVASLLLGSGVVRSGPGEQG